MTTYSASLGGAVPRLSMHGAPVRLVSTRKQNELRLLSTLVILAGLMVASISVLFADTVEEVFQYPAPFVGTALALSFVVEARAGTRNLIRTDLFMLATLYLLTFFEFLFPQPPIAQSVSLEAAETAVVATLLGFAGLVLGRHAFRATRPLPSVISVRISPRTTMMLLLGSALLGYLHMLLAVNFNVFEMIDQMSRPRFSQAWTRGRLGNLSTLLNEFALLIYLIPPIVASIFAQRRHFTLLQKAIAATLLLFVFYEGFSGGTRSVFLTHIITFGAAYALMLPRLRILKVARVAVPLLTLAWLAIYYLPEIRTVGLSNFRLETSRTDTLFVDMNLVNIALLSQEFPARYGYLGLEIPFNAAIRPIPRALWSGKPEGLSVGIEQALGVSGMTLSATFVGELWMAGGYLAIVFGALCFGALAARWNRVGASAETSQKLILFAAGFFAAGICMRSFMSVAPTLLPLLALYVFLRLRTRQRR